MAIFINLRWKLYKFYSRQLLLWGLKKGYIQPYSEELIKKLRDIYYGGVPASILLLCNGLSNGHCYDRALLMSRAFLDDDGDVKLVYATVNDLKFNPRCCHDRNPDHCFVERITKDGDRLIYDTSDGFVYYKWIYWLINHPRIRKINPKASIIRYLKSEEESSVYKEDPERDKFILPLVFPSVEGVYGKEGELYSMPGIELLQREVELYKEKVDYQDICETINQEINNPDFIADTDILTHHFA